MTTVIPLSTLERSSAGGKREGARGGKRGGKKGGGKEGEKEKERGKREREKRKERATYYITTSSTSDNLCHCKPSLHPFSVPHMYGR